MMTSTLHAMFEQWQGKPIHKWHHYLDVYEQMLAPYRGRSCTLLEIGVDRGGSLQLWRQYLGPDVQIIGCDINPDAAQHAEKNTRIFIGDQACPNFWDGVLREVPKLDIVIDDGGHFAHQQIASFEALYHHVEPDGYYLVEDTHTSYWNEYKRKTDEGSFLDFAKSRCDELHAWHFDIKNFVRYGRPHDERQGSLQVSEFCRTTKSIAFFDSQVVFRKGTVPEPWRQEVGTVEMPGSRNDR